MREIKEQKKYVSSFEHYERCMPYLFYCEFHRLLLLIVIIIVIQLLAGVLTVMSRRAEMTSPCVLFLFWFLTFCAHVIPFYSLIIQDVRLFVNHKITIKCP